MLRARRPRPIHRATVLATASLVTIGALAVPASAHIEVVPGRAQRGSFEILGFSVANEKEDASTVQVEVNFPTDTPIASLSVQPVPGWTWKADTTKLAKPVKTDDGTVTTAVSKITWSGGTIAPGEFQLFRVAAGPLPSKGTAVVFKVLQTYSDGDVVRWIEETPRGGPEPEFPAPVLKLVGKAKRR